jgi:hypothetical protein
MRRWARPRLWTGLPPGVGEAVGVAVDLGDGVTDGVVVGVAVGVAVGLAVGVAEAVAVAVGVAVGVGVGVGPAATLTTPVMPRPQCAAQKIRKGAGLRKSVRINEACVVKSSLVAVHIIRGTVLSVGSARIAAGNTVVVGGPECRPPRC